MLERLPVSHGSAVPLPLGRGGTQGQPLFCVTAHTMTASVVVLCTCYVGVFCFHPAAVGKKSRILHLSQHRARAQTGVKSAAEHAGPCTLWGEPTQKARHGRGKYLLCLKIGILCSVTWLGTAPTPPCQHHCFCPAAPRGRHAICCCAPPSPSSLPGSALHSRFYFKKKKKKLNPSAPDCTRTEKECVLKRCLHSWLPESNPARCSDLPGCRVKPPGVEQGWRDASPAVLRWAKRSPAAPAKAGRPLVLEVPLPWRGSGPGGFLATLVGAVCPQPPLPLWLQTSSWLSP